MSRDISRYSAPRTASLTVVFEARSQLVPVSSFLSVISNVISILEELEPTVSGHSTSALSWAITSASMHRPLVFAIGPEAEADPETARKVIDLYTEGMRQIESNTGVVPDWFSPFALEKAKKIVSVLNDGVARIRFIASDGEPVTPSQRLAANVDAILRTPHDELGSIEGRIEALSIHGGCSFAVWDAVSGAKIDCRIPPEMLDEAYSYMGARVSVSGRIRYDRAGQPTGIKVDSIRRLRDRKELPTWRDLEGLHLAGRTDAVEHLRSLRDA